MKALVREPVVSGEDDLGNTTHTWEEREWVIRAIAPGSMQEPDRVNRDLSLVLWTVYADATNLPSGDAEVKLPGMGEWLQIDGDPQDWSHGPPPVGPYGGHPPGAVIELRRADG